MIRLLPLVLLFAACGTRSQDPPAPPLAPLHAPQAFHGELLSLDRVFLSWSPVPQARHYRVSYGPTADPLSRSHEELRGTSVELEGLTPHTLYTFQVRALRQDEHSPASALTLETTLPLSALRFGADNTTDIGTWNLEHFPKMGWHTVELAAQLLGALDLDVVLLQEILSREAFDRLLAAGAYQGYYSQQSSYNINLALLYRPSYTLIEVKEPFRDQWLIFPRPPLFAHFKSPSGEDFWVVGVHLKCCGDGRIDWDNDDDEEYRRYRAMELIADYIVTFHPEDPIVLLGDFNDLVTDPASQSIFLPLLESSEVWTVADLEIARDRDALWSYPLWPSHLDHLLLSAEFLPYVTPENSAVAVLPVHHAFPEDLRQMEEELTDHLPVALSLKTLP